MSVVACNTLSVTGATTVAPIDGAGMNFAQRWPMAAAQAKETLPDRFDSSLLAALRLMLEHQLTGEVGVLEPGGLEHSLWLRAGRVLWLDTADEVSSLAAVLVSEGVVPARQMKVLTEVVADGPALAEALVRRNIASSVDVQAAAQLCSQQRLIYMLECATTLRFTVTPGASVFPGLEPLPAVDAFLLAARVSTNLRSVDAYITRLGATQWRVQSHLSSARLGWTRDESRVFDKLAKAPFVVGQVIATSAPRTVHSVVFALALSGALVRAETTVEPVSVRAQESSPASAIRARRSTGGSGSRAAEEADKAEKALGRGAHDLAKRHIRAALAIDPSNVSWRALETFITAEARGKPPAAEPRFYQRELTVLDMLIEQAPQSADPLYYRARLFVRLGLLERAQRDFAAAATLNPFNRHAVEEARRLAETEPKSSKDKTSKDKTSKPPKDKRGWFRW